LAARKAMTIMTVVAIATAVALLVALETVTYGVKYTVGLEVKSILPADLMVYTSSAILPQNLEDVRIGEVPHGAPARFILIKFRLSGG